MDFVEQLKSAVDIVAVIGQYVRLKRVGAGPRYMGLCPFHAEKTPSFSVHGAHQFYKCFGCGLGGDVIKFVMEIERLSFYEALKLLAERHGIPMPRRTEYSDPETKLRAAVYRMHEIAFKIFRAALEGPAGAEARAYLLKRRVPPALVEEFGLGYAEKSGQALVRAFEKEGLDAEQMEASGLVLKRQDSSGFFDRFRNRLMFPIHSESAKIIAFGGRALSAEDEPKYLNSPETSIYRKSHVLYNLHRAKTEIRKQDRSLLVEGYMDVIGVWAAGVREPVASCGTALTSQQVRMLKRHSERIVVNFDADAAGVGAAERSIQMLLEEGIEIRVLELEGGLDPDEYVQQHGAEAYRRRLENAPGYFHWLADRARVRYDARTSEGRIASLKFLLPAIQRVSDKLERATIANDLATYLGIEPGLVLEHFRKAAAERRDAGPAPARQTVKPLERILLSALLASQEARLAVLPKLKSMPALQQFSTRRIFQALLAASETQSRFTFTELEGRLEDNDKELLASLVFADEGNEEKDSLEQAQDCLRRIENDDRESQRAALRARVREAERAGNLAEALKWTEELGRLDRA
jgi:DNA primase